MTYKWKVVPICKEQLLDINKEDILNSGLYRYCDIYKGGGGYDQFNKIFKRRYGQPIKSKQFVVQLFGCPLSCPYCYVTKNGVFGKYQEITTKELLNAYKQANTDVFHLMGGAPALYLNHWKDLCESTIIDVFHSDFLLIENTYEYKWLNNLCGLHAVSLKERYLYTENQIKLLWDNLYKIIKSNVNFYITFTGKDEFSDEIYNKFGNDVLQDSFVIKIKKYNALQI